MKATIALLAAVGFSALSAPANSQSSPLPDALRTHACTEGLTKAKAVCGTLTVFEDRSAHAGRTIAIAFIDIRAIHPSGKAVAYNPGGPGGASTPLAAAFADDRGLIGKLRQHDDILLVDNRGTGMSHPLDCNFAPPARPDLYFAQSWPDQIVRTCRAKLSTIANLSDYTTADAADDLDDVRAALGIDKLVLFGGSYGTRFYMQYARQHPDRVESAVLEGNAPPHFYIIPLAMAGGAQSAMDATIRACDLDATCHRAFPHLRAHFATLVKQFDRASVAMSMHDDATGKSIRVALSREEFDETLRHALYEPSIASSLPVILERAYAGNDAALANLVDNEAQLFAGGQQSGLNLSVTCAEDLPYITESMVAQSSVNSFEGDARVRAQQRACHIWNVAPDARVYERPVSSTIPMLLVNGSDDPATPPQYARQAIAMLPNSRLIIVPGASHDGDMPACIDSAIATFVQTRSTQHLMLRDCAAHYRRPPFQMLTAFESMPGEPGAAGIRIRRLFSSLASGHVDRTLLTIKASKELDAQSAAALAAFIKGSGPVQSIVYRGVIAKKSDRIYRYLVHLRGADVNLDATVDAAGQVSHFEMNAS